MDKKNSIQNIKIKKEEILGKLAAAYEEIFQLNCEQTKLEYDFPDNFRVRKFTVENENGKLLTFGKVNLKKIDLYQCEIWAYQLKRNGDYYNNPEPVPMDKFSKLQWLEI